VERLLALSCVAYGEFAVEPRAGLVGRTYAGVLGCLAFATVVVHGAIHQAGIEATVLRAVGTMMGFGVLGFMLGSVAENVVEESVRAKMAQELARRAAESQDGTAATAKA
jgi:hypothetical protein